MTEEQIKVIEDSTSHKIDELLIDDKWGTRIPNYANGKFKKDPFICFLETKPNNCIEMERYHRMIGSTHKIISADGTIL